MFLFYSYYFVASQLEDFRLTWVVLCKLWKAFERCRRKNPKQVNIFTNFQLGLDSAIQYLQVCYFIKVLIAAPSNTSCIEWGYCSLEMLCAPPRNRQITEHLKTLFLLATLKIPVNITLKSSEWKKCWRIRHFSRHCSLLFIQYLGCTLLFYFNCPINSSKNFYLGPCTEHKFSVMIDIMWSTFFISSLLLFSSTTYPGFHSIFTIHNMKKCEHNFEC